MKGVVYRGTDIWQKWDQGKIAMLMNNTYRAAEIQDKS